MTTATATTVGELFAATVAEYEPHDWLADGDQLTPTSKLKRRAIAAKYATEIEGMYARP